MDFDFSLPVRVTHGSQIGEVLAPILGQGPVFWNDRLQGWMICGYDEVKTVFKRHRDFQNGRSPQRLAFGYDAMLFHDTGLHNRLRAVWANEVLPQAVNERLDLLGRIAGARHQIVREKLAAGEAVELVAVFQDYTTDITTTLMDVPDQRRADFKRWNAIISGTAQLALLPGDPRIAQRDTARAELFAFLASEVERHKARGAAASPSLNLTLMMIAAEGEEGITAQVVLDNLVNLFLGALDTTVRWMGNIVVQLLQNPDLLTAVTRDPGLIPDFLEELQRHQSVVQVTTRHLETEDMELGGQTLRKGDMVYIMPGLAGRDAEVFPEPDRFDLTRRPDSEKSQLGFGFGFHQCLGMHLARAEVTAFFKPLLEEMRDWEIASMDYGASWSLWGPVALNVRRRT